MQHAPFFTLYNPVHQNGTFLEEDIYLSGNWRATDSSDSGEKTGYSTNNKGGPALDPVGHYETKIKPKDSGTVRREGQRN